MNVCLFHGSEDLWWCSCYLFCEPFRSLCHSTRLLERMGNEPLRFQLMKGIKRHINDTFIETPRLVYFYFREDVCIESVMPNGLGL